MLGLLAGALAAGLSLAALEPTELSLPQGQAQGQAQGQNVGTEILALGPFRLIGVQNGVRSYEAPSPIRSRALFFMSPPDNMKLLRGNASFAYDDDWAKHDRSNTWEATPDSIIVRIRPDSEPLKAGDIHLVYPKALEREKALQHGSSPLADTEFIRQSFQVGDRTRSGLYLPAPASASWTITLPENAAFQSEIGLIPPEVDTGQRSDGATLEVLVDDVVVQEQRISTGAFQAIHVDLSEWSGKSVKITLRTKDNDTAGDYVQLASPLIYTPNPHPKRVILVFVDTLRRDHIQAYGYARDNTPALTARAQNAVVFEDARTIAPWTLPSSRAVLSGRQPEWWSVADTLPEILQRAGWVTGAFVGNVYLSTNFDMSGGWGEHGCVNWPLAEVSVKRSLDFLSRHADQDVLLMTHFMDMHLPYKEPSAYRHLFVDRDPDYLPPSFLRQTLMSAAKGRQTELKTYLEGRYDQNLRYIDDQLARLMAAAGPDATVVFFADHGEEFFDHGDLEHGHTLYDELLRIPLMLWSPDLAPRRIAAPASLLDITPTLLEMLGFPTTGLDGLSLLNLARTGNDDRFTDRARAFGRPLYGEEAWGSVAGEQKYSTKKGKEWITDLRQDPTEENNLRLTGSDPAALRAAMAAGLNRPVVLAWRLTPVKSSGVATVEVTVPDGIALAWVGDDPLMKSDASFSMLNPSTVQIRFEGKGQQREVYVLPKGDPVALAPTASLRLATTGAVPIQLKSVPMLGDGAVLGELRGGGHTIQLTYAVVPLPAGQGTTGVDPELQSALEAMGYMARDE